MVLDSGFGEDRRFFLSLFLIRVSPPWASMPPLMILWVNLHGGFLLGFVLLAIYW